MRLTLIRWRCKSGGSTRAPSRDFPRRAGTWTSKPHIASSAAQVNVQDSRTTGDHSGYVTGPTAATASLHITERRELQRETIRVAIQRMTRQYLRERSRNEARGPRPEASDRPVHTERPPARRGPPCSHSRTSQPQPPPHWHEPPDWQPQPQPEPQPQALSTGGCTAGTAGAVVGESAMESSSRACMNVAFALLQAHRDGRINGASAAHARKRRRTRPLRAPLAFHAPSTHCRCPPARPRTARAQSATCPDRPATCPRTARYAPSTGVSSCWISSACSPVTR